MLSGLLAKLRPEPEPAFRAAHPIRAKAEAGWPDDRLPTCTDLANTKDRIVRFTNRSSCADVVASMRRCGIAVIDDGLDAAMIRDARDHLHALDEATAVVTHDGPASKVARLRQQHLADALAASAGFRAIAEHPMVKAVCTDFYELPAWQLIAIYALDYSDARRANVQFHIDPTAVPKALVYLSDVNGPEDGAFEFDLGSHREGFFRMTCHYYEANKRAHEIPNSEVRMPMRVIGKAGTIILFNTVGIHRAGDVAEAHGRKSLTYFFATQDANDNDLSVPPFEYSVRHQSLERVY